MFKFSFSLLDGSIEAAGICGGSFNSGVGNCLTFITVIFTPNLEAHRAQDSSPDVTQHSENIIYKCTNEAETLIIYITFFLLWVLLV